MKIVDCTQGSARWKEARRGIPTASQFTNIVTDTFLERTGETRRTYMFELMIERVTGKPKEIPPSFDMERGTRLEPFARDWYSEKYNIEVDEVGFVYDDSMRFGASPDGRIILSDGGIEIKCLKLINHVKCSHDRVVPKKHIVQCHAEIMVCELEWLDFILYTDELIDGKHINTILRVNRDEKIIDKMKPCLDRFCDDLDALEVHYRIDKGLCEPTPKDLSKFSNDWCPFGGDEEWEIGK